MGRPKSKRVSVKEVQAINFDKIVLRRLEKHAAGSKMSLSELVNMICRKSGVVSDEGFYRMMAKEYAMKVHEYQYLEKCAREKKE